MRDNYNKCPFCNINTICTGGVFSFGKYYQCGVCPKCDTIVKTIYRLEYHGREIIPPKKGGENDDN